MNKKKTSKPEFDRKSREKDIAFLIEKIEKIHKDPYRYVKKKEFEISLQKTLDVEDKFFALAIQESLALIKDAHTEVGYIDDDLIPLWFTYLNDGKCYITGSNIKDTKPIGAEVLSVNNYPLGEINKKLSLLSSKENSEVLLKDLGWYLISNRILKYYGFGDSKNITYSTNKGDFTYKEETMFPIKRKSPLNWKDKDFLGNENYRFKMKDGNLIFQYNECELGSFSRRQLRTFKKQLLDASNSAKNIIIDIRQNSGGDVPLMQNVFKRLPFNIPIYVATGRRTFSAAIHHLVYLKHRGAIQIGENAQQKPNRFGQPKNFKLPNSKLFILCSSREFVLMPGSKLEILKPDIPLPLTIKDYITETDPLNKWIGENLN